jgi:23S rRNA (uracil1939-C5)-methyltransferase
MELVDLTPTAMAAGGDALARLADGRVVFVEGALPGEVVRARVVSSKKDYARALVVEVLTASPDRVVGHGDACGCTWSFVARPAQAALKASIVADALRRIGRLPELAVRSAPVAGSARRTTVRLGVDPSTGRAVHHLRHSTALATAASTCEALDPSLRDLVDRSRFPSAREVVLRVGVASGERAVLVVDGGDEGAMVPADVAVGPGSVVHEGVAGAWLQVSIESFFQPGPVAATALVAAVSEAVGGVAVRHLVDAYAGVGLFGATVGTDARVTAIESDPSAVDDARVNLAHLDAVVLEGEVGDWRPGDEPVDVIVADPARSGLGRPGVGAVDASGADVLVLVSCDPASLARDARLLVDRGWAAEEVVLVDAFPDTFHVEGVTRFTRFSPRGRGHHSVARVVLD